MNIVRDLRIRKGIQQKELALELGISSAAVSNWEKGKSDPSGERLRKLAEYFNVDENVILGRGASTVFVPEDPAISGKSEAEQIIERLIEKLGEQPKSEEARLLSGAVDKMPPADREKALNMMKAVYSDYFDKSEEQIS